MAKVKSYKKKSGEVVKAHNRKTTTTSQPGKKIASSNRAELESSFLKTASYNPQTKTMYLSMTGGSYMYHNVPKEVYHGLISEKGSKGKYYHKHIRLKFEGSKF